MNRANVRRRRVVQVMELRAVRVAHRKPVFTVALEVAAETAVALALALLIAFAMFGGQ